MTDASPRFGFVSFAETWNGRAAMLGILTEAPTVYGIVHQIGLNALMDSNAACRTQFLLFLFLNRALNQIKKPIPIGVVSP